jgi:hypothetical protein
MEPPNPTSARPGNRPDQRRAYRARVHLTARYASPSLHLEGHVTDVSAEGLFFCSDYLDHQGEVAQVSIDLPARGEPLELRAEVRWVNDRPHAGGMGLRLLDVSDEDRELLASLGTAVPEAPSGNA